MLAALITKPSELNSIMRTGRKKMTGQAEKGPVLHF